MKSNGFVSAGVSVSSNWVDVTINLMVDNLSKKSFITNTTSSNQVFTQPIAVSKGQNISVSVSTTSSYTRYLTIIE